MYLRKAPNRPRPRLGPLVHPFLCLPRGPEQLGQVHVRLHRTYLRPRACTKGWLMVLLAGSQPCSWRRPLAVVRGRQLNRGAVLAIVPRRVDALMPPAATEYSNVIRTVARRAHSLGGSDTDPVYSAVLATVLFPCTRGQGEGKTVCLDPNLGALLRLTGRQARGRGSVSEPSLPASSSNPHPPGTLTIPC